MRRKCFLLLLLLSCLVVLFTGCDDRKKAEKAAREARKASYRSVTVINMTDEKLIKESYLYTDSGTMIMHLNKQTTENIVFKDFDNDRSYRDVSDFKVVLIDRFGIMYAKDFTAERKGNTNVKVTKHDYVKQPGDWKRKMERRMNK